MATEQREITPEQFFDRMVPARLSSIKKVPAKQQNSLVFRFFGGQGGEWTVDLKKLKVHRGGVKKPALYLEMERNDFSEMLADRLDIVAAVSAGRIRFNGDIDLFPAFGLLMAEEQGPAKRNTKAKGRHN